jgi:hypothetical protein
MKYNFEFNGNKGILYLETHLNTKHEIECVKNDDEIFRLGGTAVNQVLIKKLDNGKYRTEYYPLDMEGKQVQYLDLDQPLDQNLARLIFINVDVIDGGENLLRRYRIDPYFGTHRVINGSH